jgi:hypothetical protein
MYAWQGWGEVASLGVSSSEHVFERWRRRNLAPTARRSNLNARDSFGSRRREGERAESEGPSVGSFLSRPRPDEPGIECRKMCFFGGALESVRATGMKATAYSLRRDAQSSFFREAAPGVLPRYEGQLARGIEALRGGSPDGGRRRLGGSVSAGPRRCGRRVVCEGRFGVSSVLHKARGSAVWFAG